MTESITKIFGIDLGTTYSCIAYVDEFGKPVIVPNAENDRLTPSVVLFEGDSVIAGKDAKASSVTQPEDVVQFVKRAMGDPNFIFEHEGKSFTPEEISSYLLKKLVQDAAQSTGETITDVIITCPAYFGINEREATRAAGTIAGLNVRQVINEPTAAAIQYGEAYSDTDKVVLVFDLGGGTFDVTMIDIKADAIEVICTGGDHNLGGKDWDDAVVRYLVEQFNEQTGLDEDILDDPDTCQELQLNSENAKMTLTKREKASVSVTHGGERVKVELTRETFQDLTRHLLEKTLSLTHEMLDEAKRKGYESFDEIILVGGSARMPQVAECVAEEFGKEPRLFDPDECVAKGAAQYGFKLSINDELIDRIAVQTGKSKEEIQDTGSENLPTEVVEKATRDIADDFGFTLGAVRRSAMEIRNVTSKSFGIVALDRNGVETTVNLIRKNTTVPVEYTQEFGTDEDGQEMVELRIMENEVGEATLPPEQSVEIGTATMDLPAGLPMGSPIEITFKLNEEGCLEMKALEVTDSRRVDVTVETTSVITGEELDEAVSRGRNVDVS